MAKARKKARKAARKAPARRKTPARKRTAAATRKSAKKSAASRAPRVLPKDSAWRKLVEKAIATPDPAAQAGAAKKK